MANTNKTKAEILQELESIKGLLLEEDDIPILQPLDESHHYDDMAADHQRPAAYTNPAVLPGQTSLFDDDLAHPSPTAAVTPPTDYSSPVETDKKTGFASHLTKQKPSFGATPDHNAPRPLAKASGENPFLPQHIRERLHGNNPPPLFEYETAKKIVSATKHIAHKINKPRQALVDDVLNSLMPQIEAELRQRLFAMSVEDLEKLLNEDEE